MSVVTWMELQLLIGHSAASSETSLHQVGRKVPTYMKAADMLIKCLSKMHKQHGNSLISIHSKSTNHNMYRIGMLPVLPEDRSSLNAVTTRSQYSFVIDLSAKILPSRSRVEEHVLRQDRWPEVEPGSAARLELGVLQDDGPW